MHTVIYQLSPLKTEFKSIQFKPPEKARAVGYHGDARCLPQTLPSCACGKTLKFACAFVSPDNSGIFSYKR